MNMDNDALRRLLFYVLLLLSLPTKSVIACTKTVLLAQNSRPLTYYITLQYCTTVQLQVYVHTYCTVCQACLYVLYSYIACMKCDGIVDWEKLEINRRCTFCTINVHSTQCTVLYILLAIWILNIGVALFSMKCTCFLCVCFNMCICLTRVH